MTAKMSAHGRLGNDPREVTTKTGTEMAIALMFLTGTSKSETTEDLAIGLVAFKQQAAILMKHSKGDLLSISGDVQVSEWSKGDEDFRQVQVICQDFVGNKASRPGGRKKAVKKKAKKSIGGQASVDDFCDDLPEAFG